MNFRVRKRGYRPLVMIVSPLLTLALGGVGWASLAAPGVTGFVEIDGNVRFDGTLLPFGTCEGGTNAGAPCNVNSDCASNSCVAFDWAKGPPGSATTGCTTTSGVVNCSGTNGLFDGGKFNGATATPTPPAFIASDPTIVAHSFGVDELGGLKNVAGACSLSATPCVVGGTPTGCPAGETCVNCGSGDPSVYTGQGSETNSADLNAETFNTSSVPPKDDISNVYAIAHQDPPFPSTSSSTDINELFAGFERVVNNGDSHVDLEFLQAPLIQVPSAGKTAAAKFPCQGGFQGHRSAGDLLLSVDFTTGGTFGTSTLRQWKCNGSPGTCVGGSNDGMSCTAQSNCPDGRCECDPGKVKIPAAYSDPLSLTFCNGGTNSGAACTSSSQCTGGGTCQSIVKQAVNASGNVSCGGWACRDTGGNQTTSLLTNDFYEVGIDLAKAGFTGCISTFLPHTRSSQSFTAVLKDFAVLGFNTCRPTTRLTKVASSSSVILGGSVTYTYTEENLGNVALTSPCPTATDKRSCVVTDDKCSPVTYVSGDTNNNNVLDPNETWTFTCTLSNITAQTMNTAIGHGLSSVDGKDVSFCSCDGTRTGIACDDSNPCSSGTCTPVEPITGHATVCDVHERAQTTVEVLTPSTCLKKSAAVTSISTTVLYRYDETNDGTIALNSPSVEDAECTTNGGTITLDNPSGDTNSNGKLDPLETWHFKCTATFTTANPTGTQQFINTAISHGCFTAGGVTKDVTVSGATPACGTAVFADADETDTNTVSVTAPTVTLGKTSCGP